MKEGWKEKPKGTLPFGWEAVDDNWMAPVPEQLEALREAQDMALSGAMSIREAARWLSTKTGRPFSHEALRRSLNKIAVAPEQPQAQEAEQMPPDWVLHPEDYQTNEDGTFILKKDGTPARKTRGTSTDRKRYHYHSIEKAKMKTRADIRAKQKKVEQLERKVKAVKASVRAKKAVAEKLDASYGGSKKIATIVSESDLEVLPKVVRDEVLADDANVAFRPHPGPQTDFLAAGEKDVLYGGAAGGGKSYAMLVDPLRYVHFKEHRFLILRKTLGELEELIDKSRELYPLAFPGAIYKESKKTWEFPSGAKGSFGYLEKDSDVYQYQGRSYTWIGFDEITHLATSFAWDYLRSRLRTTNPAIKTYMRCTANPGGVGHNWVKKRYITPAEHNTAFVGEDGITRKFIPAKLSDNPSLYEGGEYEKMLMSLDPVERKRLLEGDWDIVDGGAFPEFDPKVHVITPFLIPPHWQRVKGIDYGYRAPSCCLWAAIDPDDGTIIIYRELYEKGLTGRALAERLHDLESQEMMSIPGVLDGAAWNQTGVFGPTVGEELVQAGHKLRRADKNRKAGKIQVHERLKVRETGRPKLQIFSTCTNLIKEIIGIPLAKNDNEDVDTTVDDHAYDALRYLVMSRPPIEDTYSRMRRYKHEINVVFDEDFGY